MSAQSQHSETETLTLVAAFAIGTLGAAIFYALPGLAAALERAYGFDDVQVGYLASAHLAGLTVGSALGAKFVAKLGIRRVTRLGLLVGVIANASVLFQGAYRPFLVSMAVAGLGAGLMVTVCFVVLSRSRQVDRNFSIYTICQLLFAAAALQWMQALISAIGIGGMFALLAGLFATASLLCRYLPSSAEGVSVRLDGAPSGSVAWIALAALLIYSAAQGAVWTYLELIGDRGGIARHTVATAVAASSLVALLGPMTVAVLGTRFGRAVPLFVGLCVSLVALYLLGSPLNATRFLSAACLFNVAWNFSAPYQPALIAAIDPSGHVVAWVACATVVGLTFGPLAGALVLDATGFVGVLWLGAGFSILGFAGFASVCRKIATNRTLGDR